MKYVFSSNETKRYRFPTHINDLVMDRSQATASEVFFVMIEPGGAPPLHQHDDTEQIFFVLQGKGELEIGSEPEQFPVSPGDIVRIPVATPHTIHCVSEETLRYLAIDCFPGSRPGAEPTWDAHVRTVCREQGWRYDEVAEGQNAT
jgi:mannose-6-phosphate isomerase-like protein (cupin superfamily)